MSAGGAARGNLPFWDGVWNLETQAPHPLLANSACIQRSHECGSDVVVDVLTAAVVEGLAPDAGVGVLMGRGWDIGVSYRI